MNASEKKGKIYKPVLFTVGALLLIEIIFGVFFTEEFGSLMVNMMYIVGDNFGWWINLLCVSGIFIGIAIVVARYGDVVIGGKDAKPDFTTWQWFSMSICGGIGCGLLFWAMGEPIYHYMDPPIAAGIEAETRDAAIFAVSQAMFDWSFVQYFIYTLPALAFALLAFNYRKSLSFQSLVDVTFKRKMTWLTTLLHICCAWAVASGVSNSMGAGLMQISGGINAVFGIPQGPTMYLFITIFVAVFFILSCLTGIHKGLSYVSTACMICFFALLIYVVVFGDAQFIGKIGTEASGQILDNFFSKITYNNTLAPEDQWANEWSITYWNSFFIYAPVIGMFLARMGKGRTVRQFVLVEILVPSLFCCLFIAIFAGMIMKMQCEGLVDVWGKVQELGNAVRQDCAAAVPGDRCAVVCHIGGPELLGHVHPVRTRPGDRFRAAAQHQDRGRRDGIRGGVSARCVGRHGRSKGTAQYRRPADDHTDTMAVPDLLPIVRQAAEIQELYDRSQTGQQGPQNGAERAGTRCRGTEGGGLSPFSGALI